MNLQDLLKADPITRAVMERQERLNAMTPEENGYTVVMGRRAMLEAYLEFGLEALRKFGPDRDFVCLERDAIPIKWGLDAMALAAGRPIRASVFPFNREMLPKQISGLYGEPFHTYFAAIKGFQSRNRTRKTARNRFLAKSLSELTNPVFLDTGYYGTIPIFLVSFLKRGAYFLMIGAPGTEAWSERNRDWDTHAFETLFHFPYEISHYLADGEWQIERDHDGFSTRSMMIERYAGQQRAFSEVAEAFATVPRDNYSSHSATIRIPRHA